MYRGNNRQRSSYHDFDPNQGNRGYLNSNNVSKDKPWSGVNVLLRAVRAVEGPRWQEKIDTRDIENNGDWDKSKSI